MTTKDAKYLFQVREALGISQSEFAERLGYDRRTVLRWENGQGPIPPAIIMAARWLELATLPRAGQLKLLRKLPHIGVGLLIGILIAASAAPI